MSVARVIDNNQSGSNHIVCCDDGVTLDVGTRLFSKAEMLRAYFKGVARGQKIGKYDEPQIDGYFGI